MKTFFRAVSLSVVAGSNINVTSRSMTSVKELLALLWSCSHQSLPVSLTSGGEQTCLLSQATFNLLWLNSSKWFTLNVKGNKADVFLTVMSSVWHHHDSTVLHFRRKRTSKMRSCWGLILSLSHTLLPPKASERQAPLPSQHGLLLSLLFVFLLCLDMLLSLSSLHCCSSSSFSTYKYSHLFQMPSFTCFLSLHPPPLTPIQCTQPVQRRSRNRNEGIHDVPPLYRRSTRAAEMLSGMKTYHPL